MEGVSLRADGRQLGGKWHRAAGRLEDHGGRRVVAFKDGASVRTGNTFCAVCRVAVVTSQWD